MSCSVTLIFRVYISDMKKDDTKRNYVMRRRAEKVAQTEERIMQETVGLWREISLSDITLEKVAERSGVTVRTLLRKYGSRDGLIETCILHKAGDPERQTDPDTIGNVDGLLHSLLNEYEEMGDAVLRTIYASENIPAAQKILAQGRRVHREWCETVFAPYLDHCPEKVRETKLLAFIAATEIYLWKLLRRDMGKSYGETYEVFHQMLAGLIK